MKFNKGILASAFQLSGTSLEASQPVLCAQCHYSPALDLAGTGPTTGLPTFSDVMHAYHCGLKDLID